MTYTPDYPTFVESRCKDGATIKLELTPRQAHLIHMVLGLCGEIGELADAIKKHVIYQKELDYKNVREEAGDVRFYYTGLLNGVGMTDNEVIADNIEKLQKRYHTGAYSDKQAQERADK